MLKNCIFEDLNLPTCNYWIFPGMGKGEEYGDFIASTRKEFCKEGRCLGFLGFPSAKDPDFNRRFPGKSTAVLISEMSWELVEEWQEERCDHRSDEYQALKEKWAKHLLESCLWPRFPELKDKLTFMKVGTPLSSAHYLGNNKDLHRAFRRPGAVITTFINLFGMFFIIYDRFERPDGLWEL